MRNHPKGARFASFGIGLCIFALMPTEIGYQDIASLLARQPGVAERWQKRVYSPAASIQLATYSFSRPIGTSTPESANYRLASLETQGADITGSVSRNPVLQAPPRYQASEFPKVDRTLKGDRLAPQSAVPPPSAAPPLDNPASSNSFVAGAKTAAAPSATPTSLDPELQEALSAPPLAQYDVSMSLEARPLDDMKTAPEAVEPSHDSFDVKTASLFFGNSSLGGSLSNIERWQPGEEPTIVLPDPDMRDPDMRDLICGILI